jgi:hypothetical protein
MNAAPLGPRLAICALAIAIGSSADAADVVRAWVTTADQSRLLAREPDVRLARRRPIRFASMSIPNVATRRWLASARR